MQAFQRKHPPVEKDKYYVVTDETLEAWWDRPESWSFEAEPWGTKNVKIERALAVPKFEVPALPVPKPVQVWHRVREIESELPNHCQSVATKSLVSATFIKAGPSLIDIFEHVFVKKHME